HQTFQHFQHSPARRRGRRSDAGIMFFNDLIDNEIGIHLAFTIVPRRAAGRNRDKCVPDIFLSVRRSLPRQPCLRCGLSLALLSR
ncbi:hypothetical protein J8J40_26780, partial [Mycobacterium tuberculosis]|nr:hypothetical protein [Mycobacterium tuberculosis]MBP0650657.1 hypothetical protein [Mycobacterium tuberculosis]